MYQESETGEQVGGASPCRKWLQLHQRRSSRRRCCCPSASCTARWTEGAERPAAAHWGCWQLWGIKPNTQTDFLLTFQNKSMNLITLQPHHCNASDPIRRWRRSCRRRSCRRTQRGRRGTRWFPAWRGWPAWSGRCRCWWCGGSRRGGWTPGENGGGVSVGRRWCVLKADWLMWGSHLGGLQDLDILVGAIALVVLSSNHTVVGPDGEEENLKGQFTKKIPNNTEIILDAMFDNLINLQQAQWWC